MEKSFEKLCLYFSSWEAGTCEKKGGKDRTLQNFIEKQTSEFSQLSNLDGICEYHHHMSGFLTTIEIPLMLSNKH